MISQKLLVRLDNTISAIDSQLEGSSVVLEALADERPTTRSEAYACIIGVMRERQQVHRRDVLLKMPDASSDLLSFI